MHQIGTGSGEDKAVEDGARYLDLFIGAESVAEGSAVVLEALRVRLSKALSVPFDDLDPGKALHHFGVDSLLAVELRNWFAKEWSADVAIFDIMGAPNLAAISVTAASRSSLKVKG